MYCSNCGADNPDGATYCQECGKELIEGFPTKYSKVSLLGFAGVIIGFGYTIFFLLSLISGIYLYTRPEKFAKKRGKFLILLVVIIWILIGIFWILFSSLFTRTY